MCGPLGATLFPYTTLFRSAAPLRHSGVVLAHGGIIRLSCGNVLTPSSSWRFGNRDKYAEKAGHRRSEEHTSELQSHVNLVWRLLLGKKYILRTLGLTYRSA